MPKIDRQKRKKGLGAGMKAGSGTAGCRKSQASGTGSQRTGRGPAAKAASKRAGSPASA